MDVVILVKEIFYRKGGRGDFGWHIDKQWNEQLTVCSCVNTAALSTNIAFLHTFFYLHFLDNFNVLPKT